MDESRIVKTSLLGRGIVEDATSFSYSMDESFESISALINSDHILFLHKYCTIMHIFIALK